jgi:hypothetical protein
MEILALLFLFQIKHWYADFKIQTYMQTVKKGIWLDLIGISHSLDHVWGTLTILMVFNLFYPIPATTILLIGLIEGLAHYAIDYVKVKHGCKDNTKPLFWNQFGLDQLAHQACYLLIVAFLLV